MKFKSNLFDPVDHKTLKVMIKKAFSSSTTIADVILLRGGQFNTTYLLKINSPNIKIILRIAPSNQDVLFDFERSMMSVEPFINKLLNENGVPTPEVLFFDNSHEIIARDYIILEYIDAIALSDPSVPQEVWPEIMKQLGIMTRKIHSIKSNTFGWPLGEGKIIGNKSWYAVLEGFFQEIINKIIRYNIFPESDMEKIYHVFKTSKNVFDMIKVPSLVHNDLWAPNVLIREENNCWQIAAIIDSDRAMFADPEYDFILWSNQQAFFSGYKNSLSDSDASIFRRNFYALVLNLFCAYAYKVQIGNVQEHENAKERSKQSITKILEGYSKSSRGKR